MRKSYHYIYKYLILYIVLSFIDNKYFINCQKIRNKMKFYEEMSNEVLCPNGAIGAPRAGGGGGSGGRGNVTDLSTSPPTSSPATTSSIHCNYTALPQKSESNEDKHPRE